MADLDHIVDDIWKKYDEDASGTLNKEDCVPFFAEFIANRPDLGLKEADQGAWFDNIDSDHDGTISKEEMKAYLASIHYTHHHH